MPNEDVTIVAEFERLPLPTDRWLWPRRRSRGYLRHRALVDAEMAFMLLHILAGDPITFAFTPSGEDRSFPGSPCERRDGRLLSKSCSLYTYIMPDTDSHLHFAFDMVNKTILRQTIAIQKIW